MMKILKMLLNWLSKLSCKSKCCSGSSCECNTIKDDAESENKLE